MIKDSSVNQAELALILGVSPRTVREKHDAGMPHERKGAEVRYPLPAAVEWYYRAKYAVRDGVSMKARKLAAEAELKELELSRRRGELIHVDDLEALHTRPLAQLRARLLALPGRIAADLPMPSVEAVEIIEPVVHEFMRELSEAEDIDPADLPAA